VSDTIREQALAKVRSFPAVPGTAAKVLKLLRDPRSSAADVEKAMRFDPGFTANVLRMANAAYFGYARKIGSVRQAVVRLGWDRVYQLVVASCVNGIMNKAVPGYCLAPGELWRHAVGVSVSTEHLMKKLSVSVVEEAFTAGLLHDVGKLVMGSFVEADFSRIDELISEKGISFAAAEREVLGINHAEIGAYILESWALPEDLVDVVRWHHEPELAGEGNILVDAVHVADALCLMIGIGTGREGLKYEPAPAVMARLGIQVSELESVAGFVLQDLAEFCESMETMSHV
jgi:putative nucleotidyltransferase with HDIG domain